MALKPMQMFEVWSQGGVVFTISATSYSSHFKMLHYYIQKVDLITSVFLLDLLENTQETGNSLGTGTLRGTLPLITSAPDSLGIQHD